MSKILKIVLDVVKEMGEEDENDFLINVDEHTELFGRGTLDSMGVVLLISELEDVIYEELEREIVLADDRAMSQRTSPFKSVKTLVNYIEKLLAESET
jgi:acyl carrier protein